MGLVPPGPGFLQGLCRLTRDAGALLLFDEVMAGFRVHPRGAQARYGVTPDLTTLGKVIGGGLPVGAYGGRRENHGEDRTFGARVSGGNALGQPSLWRPGSPLSRCSTIRRFGSAWRAPGRGSSPPWNPPRAQQASRFSARAWARCSGSSSPTRRSPIGRPRSAPARDAPPSTARCSSAAFYFAPSQFEAAFLAIAHGERRLTERSKRRGRSSVDCTGWSNSIARQGPDRERGRAGPRLTLFCVCE